MTLLAVYFIKNHDQNFTSRIQRSTTNNDQKNIGQKHD